jgi:hypothetical protein
MCIKLIQVMHTVCSLSIRKYFNRGWNIYAALTDDKVKFNCCRIDPLVFVKR